MTPADNATGQPVLYQSSSRVSEACRKMADSVYGTFAREVGTQLSVYVRSNVSVKYAGLEESTFAGFAASRTPMCSASSLKCASAAPALESRITLDLEPALLFAFVEAMLGGKPGTVPAPDRAPTQIEKQLLALVLTTITSQLERVWSNVAPLSLEFSGIESESKAARLFSSAEAVLLARFDVSVGEQTGSLAILMPAHAAEAVIEGVKREPSEAAEIPESTRISEALLDSSVHFDVWLDGVSLQFRDLVQLREGYVIKFDYPTERHLQSTLNGAAGFPGQVVSTGRKRAFLIQNETA